MFKRIGLVKGPGGGGIVSQLLGKKLKTSSDTKPSDLNVFSYNIIAFWQKEKYGTWRKENHNMLLKALSLWSEVNVFIGADGCNL